MRVVVPLLVVLALLALAPQVSDPALVAAVGQLGPISGWRCARLSTYVYDPRRESPDRTLVQDPPEALIPDTVTPVRVEVSLRGGDTTVWTGEEADPDRVFVLTPGTLRGITVERTAICYSHLGNWRIVGDHALQ